MIVEQVARTLLGWIMKLVKQALAWFKQPDSTPLHRNYVISETFSDIANCFDAEAIWGRPRMVVSDRRLRSLLNDHRFTVGGTIKTFSHIYIELAAMNVEHDRRISHGAQTNCMSLAEALTGMHREAFGRFLSEGESPRYIVLPALDLHDDQVRVRFGHGVYIPGDSEPALWQIETSRDGTIFPKHEGNIALPNRQHLCVLGGSSDTVSLTCPGWPFSNDVSLVIVNDPLQEHLSITAEPLGALSVRRDEKLNSFVIGLPNSVKPSPHAPVYYIRTSRLNPFNRPADIQLSTPAVIRRRASGTAEKPDPADFDALRPQRMEPKLSKTTTTPPPPGSHSTNQTAPIPLHADPCEGTLTMLPPIPKKTPINDGTWLVSKALIRGGRLNLCGIALQRPSAYRSYGITALTIGFDAAGQVVPPQSEQWLIRININTDDEVEIETRHGRRPLATGETIPLAGQCAIQFDELPAALSDRYIGCLRIPEKISQDLIDGSDFLVSRDATMSNFARIQTLNGQGFISATKDPGGDCMGVSSRQCILRLENEKLNILVEGQAPVIVLDSELSIPTNIERQKCHVLSNREYLLIGHYLWRYDKLTPSASIANIHE